MRTTIMTPSGPRSVWRPRVIKYQGATDAKPPVGVSPEEPLYWARYAGLTDTGVPMDQSGYAKDWLPVGPNYIKKLQSKTGANIFRAMETQWDPGRPGNMWGGVNFGRILLDCKSERVYGVFIYQFLRALRKGRGLMFDGEYAPIKNRNAYRITKEDLEVGVVWGYHPTELLQYGARCVEFRNRQIATIFRLMYFFAMRKYKEMDKCVVYSGYPKLIWDSPTGATVESWYGVDWKQMTDSTLSWVNITLPPITHAMVAWHTDVKRPREVHEWIRDLNNKNDTLSLLHVVQLAPAHAEDESNWDVLIEDIISLLRRKDWLDDGIGMVNLMPPDETWHRFDPLDRLVYQKLGQAMRRHGFMQDTNV